VSPLRSPVTLTSSTDSMSLNLVGLNTIESFIDSGSFGRNFERVAVLGMGEEEAYLARHKLDGEVYLVKVFKMTANLHEDIREHVLYAEINRVKQLRARHIMRYVTCWIESEEESPPQENAEVKLYVQMEHLEGKRIFECEDDTIRFDWAVELVRKLAKLISFIHDKGLQHGNITTENIYFNRFGFFTLGDFEYSERKVDDYSSFVKVVGEIGGKLKGYEKERFARVVKELREIREMGLAEKMKEIIR
jgi:tRNA A-37 threonylcarbamoyl transferase component Bud32